MSEVRETTTISRLRNGKEVTVKMECNVGDPYQDYRGEGSEGQAIVTPDWTVEKDQPILWASIYSNLKRIIYTDDRWTYNVTPLQFGEDGLSTNQGLEGVFKRITHDGVPALRIVKNLAGKENQDNDSISLDCAIKVAGIDDRVQGQMTIQIGRASADVYKGTILPMEGKGYRIENVDDTLKVRGQLRHGGSIVPDKDYKVEWKKIVDGALVPLTASGGAAVVDGSDHSIVITADMVDSVLNLFAYFMNPEGALLTTDTQGIVDVSDPLYIEVNRTPATGTIINDSDTVVISPRVMAKVKGPDGTINSVQKTEFNGKFKFVGYKEDDTLVTLDNDHSKVPTASQTITANDLDKVEPGRLKIEIIANDKF